MAKHGRFDVADVEKQLPEHLAKLVRMRGGIDRMLAARISDWARGRVAALMEGGMSEHDAWASKDYAAGAVRSLGDWTGFAESFVHRTEKLANRDSIVTQVFRAQNNDVALVDGATVLGSTIFNVRGKGRAFGWLEDTTESVVDQLIQARGAKLYEAKKGEGMTREEAERQALNELGEQVARARAAVLKADPSVKIFEVKKDDRMSVIEAFSDISNSAFLTSGVVPKWMRPMAEMMKANVVAANTALTLAKAWEAAIEADPEAVQDMRNVLEEVGIEVRDIVEETNISAEDIETWKVARAEARAVAYGPRGVGGEAVSEVVQQAEAEEAAIRAKEAPVSEERKEEIQAEVRAQEEHVERVYQSADEDAGSAPEEVRGVFVGDSCVYNAAGGFYMGLIDKSKLRDGIEQVKVGAKGKHGVIAGRELVGDFQASAAPLYVWKRKNGELWLISGRHRFELLLRDNGVNSHACYVFVEDAEHDEKWARMMDYENNMRDDQADEVTAAMYVRETGYGDAELQKRGLLRNESRSKRGALIGRWAREELWTRFVNGAVKPMDAEVICHLTKNLRDASRVEEIQRRCCMLLDEGKGWEYIGAMVQLMANKESVFLKPGLLDLGADFEADLARAAAWIEKNLRKLNEAISLVKQGRKLSGKKREEAERLGIATQMEGGEDLLADLEGLRAKFEMVGSYPDLVAQAQLYDGKTEVDPVGQLLEQQRAQREREQELKELDAEAYLRAKQAEAVPEFGFSVSEEMADIKAAAEKDGTFMTAPNGKPTNLTERQWLQVRTKTFKEWFGDWEKVADLSFDGSEYNNETCLKMLAEEAGTPFVNDETGIEAEINNRQRGKITSGKAQRKSRESGFSTGVHNFVAAHIRRLFKHAVHIGDYRDKNQSDDILEIKRFVCPVLIKGVEAFAYMTVKKLKQHGHKIYTLELDTIERLGGNLDEHFEEMLNPAPSKEIVARVKALSKTYFENVSKVVDENGEPRVVYHGSPYYGFTVFDKARRGERDKGDFGRGFYFTPNRGYAATYGVEGYWNAEGDDSKVYACFLNIREPMQVQARQAENMERWRFEDAEGVMVYTDRFYDLAWNDVKNLSEIVVFDSSQVKSATQNRGTFDGNNPDITYSVTGGKNLAAVHSIPVDTMLDVEKKLGGLPKPSIAITRLDKPYSWGYSERVYLIGKPELADPQKGNLVYDRDAWTGKGPFLLEGGGAYDYRKGEYFEPTLEEFVARTIKKKGQEDGSSFRGQSAVAIGTMDAVKAHREKLSDTDTSNAQKAETDEALKELIENVVKLSKKGLNEDAVAMVLARVCWRSSPMNHGAPSEMKTSRDTAKRILNELGVRVKDIKKPMVDSFMKAVAGLQNELEDYLESVPQRAVMFNEWEYAVMPESMKGTPGLDEMLERNGIKPVWHDGTEEGRRAALAGLVDNPVVSFSVVGEHAANWDELKERAFKGRDDGKLRVELDASGAKIKGFPKAYPVYDVMRKLMDAGVYDGEEYTVYSALRFVEDMTEAEKGEKKLNETDLKEDVDGIPDLADEVERGLKAAGLTWESNIQAVRGASFTALSKWKKTLEEELKSKSIEKPTGEAWHALVEQKPGLASANVGKRMVSSWSGKRLDDVLDFPELYKAYPQLRNIQLAEDFGLGLAGASYSEFAARHGVTVGKDDGQFPLGFINMNPNYAGWNNKWEAISILLHEVQHAIQGIEGFAKGGNKQSVIQTVKRLLENDEYRIEWLERDLRWFAAVDIARDYLKEAKRLRKYPNAWKYSGQRFRFGRMSSSAEEIREAILLDIAERYNAFLRDDTAETLLLDMNDALLPKVHFSSLESIEAGLEKLKKLKSRKLAFRGTAAKKSRKLKDLQKRYDGMKRVLDKFEYEPYELYLRLAGEIEARNVELRRDWTAEERAARPFNETLEYPGEALVTYSLTVEAQNALHLLEKRRDEVEAQVMEELERAKARGGESFSMETVTENWQAVLHAYLESLPKPGTPEHTRDMVVCPTPAVMQMVGAKGWDMVVTPGVIDKVMRGKHAVSREALEALPGALADPICIAVSDTPGCLEVVTELKEGDDNVLVAVQLESRSSEKKEVKVNRIASMYGKEKIGSLLTHPMLYWNKTKARVWLQAYRLQLPAQVLPKRASGRKILKPEDLVKYKQENNLSFSMTSEMESIKLAAEADGTFMKAPNGKATNLTELQWLQVRTAAFKRWFGDWENDPANASKVVDENGEPKVVYHGARHAGFRVFDNEEGDRKSDAPDGSNFFSSSRSVAYSYAGRYDEPDLLDEELQEEIEEYGIRDMDAGIYEVFLNIRDPYVFDFKGRNWEPEEYFYSLVDERGDYITPTNGDEYYNSREEAEERAKALGLEEYEVYTEYKNTNIVAQEAMDMDCDGAIIENVVDEGRYGYGTEATDYIVFSSEQVKSATQNRGTFDGSNPDITYSVTGGKNLAAVHSLSAEKFLAALELGGMPMPSVAVTRLDRPYEWGGAGAINLIGKPEMVDPRKGADVYTADAWTGYVPTLVHKTAGKEDRSAASVDLRDIKEKYQEKRDSDSTLHSLDYRISEGEKTERYNMGDQLRSRSGKRTILREAWRIVKIDVISNH